MRFRKSGTFALRTVIFILFLLSSSYFIVQVHASEPSLIEIFNYFGFTNVSETNVETFSAGTYNITLYAEFAGYSDENELSYYEVGTSIFNVIFTGPEGGSGYLSPPATKTFTADYQFGLSMLSPGPRRYFTETSRNSDGEQHAKVYTNLDDPSMFLIGFENQYGAGDRDYNDMVFSLECSHDLTVSAGVGGTTDPVPGVYSHSCGSSVLVEAVADNCYVFDHWELDTVDVGSANPYSVLMDDDHALHAVFTQVTYDLTVSAGVGGTTDPVPGTYTYNGGTNVQVAAIPDANYDFAYWELDGAYNGTGNPTTVLMNENHTLKAVFAVVTYTLTITTTTGGTTIPAAGAYTYDAGSSVPVQALPSANYMFDHWELDCSYAGTDNPTTVQMDDDHTLHAVFSLINYTLTITTTAGGTTDPALGTYVYASGSSVVVTATPDVNYKFIHWEIDGSNITDNPITVLMDKDYTLHAVFQLLTYRLTILSSTGGTTDPVPGTHVYVNGSYASVTAIPDEHYLLDYWMLDDNPAGSDNPLSVLMTDDHTLQPFFKLRNYTLTITATAGGTTDPTPGTYTYPAGTTVEVTAIPDAGYRLDYWEIDGSPVGSVNPISLTMNSDLNLNAVFAETHTLIITMSEGGTTDPSPGTYTYETPTNVVVEATPSAGYLFDYWEFDGEDVGSENPTTVYVGSSHALKAFFTPITYQLTITTTSGGTTGPVPGTYTYAVDSSVQVTAIPDTDYVFDHWELDTVDVGSANPYTVLMDEDHTLKAVFTYSPLPPPLSVSINPPSATIPTGDSVAFTSAAGGGTPPYTYQWYLNGHPVSGATSESWAFTPTNPGNYYIYLKVTDKDGVSKDSDTAKVSVALVPVGGPVFPIKYTHPSESRRPFLPVLFSIALIAISLFFVGKTRKRKK